MKSLIWTFIAFSDVAIIYPNALSHTHTTYVQMRDIQLTEKIEKDRNCFQIRQVSTGLFYTLQVRFHEKTTWHVAEFNSQALNLD